MTGRSRPLAALSLVLLASLAADAGAASLADDPFVSQVRGEWEGSGDYDGNALALRRSWTLELGDQFLKADMRVHMANGASFGALMYWKIVSRDVYDVVWMDGIGRRQTLRATRVPETGRVSTTFLDEFAENGPEWRTWEFEPLGADAYVERLFRVLPAGREELVLFSFRRVEPADDARSP